MVEVMACLLRLLQTKSRAKTLNDLSEVQLFYPITDVTAATNLSSRDVVTADARADEGDARHRSAASARQHEQPRGGAPTAGQVRGSQDVATADATAEEGGVNNHLDVGIEDCI
jgi:hypothetical protein